jgi:hypothetical protein
MSTYACTMKHTRWFPWLVYVCSEHVRQHDIKYKKAGSEHVRLHVVRTFRNTGKLLAQNRLAGLKTIHCPPANVCLTETGGLVEQTEPEYLRVWLKDL